MANLAIKIDLNKCGSIKADKTGKQWLDVSDERFFKGKGGAVYLDLVAFESRNSQYGDSHFVSLSISKAEREAGKKGPIVGNIKELGGRKQEAPAERAPQTQSNDDVVF